MQSGKAGSQHKDVKWPLGQQWGEETTKNALKAFTFTFFFFFFFLSTWIPDSCCGCNSACRRYRVCELNLNRKSQTVYLQVQDPPVAFLSDLLPEITFYQLCIPAWQQLLPSSLILVLLPFCWTISSPGSPNSDLMMFPEGRGLILLNLHTHRPPTLLF